VLSGAASIVWNLNEKFAVIAEIGVNDEKLPGADESDYPITMLGGMWYAITETLVTRVHVGSVANSPEDAIIALEMDGTF
jgi:hypothetical protein